MKIKSTSGKGNFEILNENKRILEVNYKNLFSSTATTSINNKKIEIKSKNVWNSKFDIFKDDIDIGDIIFNWKGNIILRLIKKDVEVSFLIRGKGFWNTRFEMLDEKNNIILVIKPSINWKKVSYDYDVEFNPNYNKTEIEKTELLIYCAYSANLYLSMMNGSAGVLAGM